MDIQGNEVFSTTDAFTRPPFAAPSSAPPTALEDSERTLASDPPPLGPEELNDLAETLGQQFASTGVTFDIHDESGHIVARVIDRESGEVIRQVPEEAFLELARRAARLSGQLLDVSA